MVRMAVGVDHGDRLVRELPDGRGKVVVPVHRIDQTGALFSDAFFADALPPDVFFEAVLFAGALFGTPQGERREKDALFLEIESADADEPGGGT